MSTLAVNAFDFAFPSCEPSTPPSFTFDPSLLEIPFHPGHGRSSSRGSVYSMVSAAESSVADTASTRMSTPNRSSPPVRSHGPLLLPKIRHQDQALESSPPKRVKTSPAPTAVPRAAAFRRAHHRSFTNPEPITYNPLAFGPVAPSIEEQQSASLLCSPVMFAQDNQHGLPIFSSAARRASTCGSLDTGAVEKFGFPTYRQMPSYVASSATPEPFMFPSYAPRAPSPLSLAAAATPEPTAAAAAAGPTTNLMTYLTAPNPAPSLVLNYRSAHSDPLIKHFWWDVRQVLPWSDFNASTILGLPGASALLACPVPAPVLPPLAMPSRQPETEASLHGIFAHYYLPKLNAALAISSCRPISLSVPPKAVAPGGNAPELLFVGNAAGESATAAAMFGGKPTARMVGIVRTFNNFNTGMRTEDNIKKVEYLRGLSAVHHAMREHGCRFGFIMTEIELVVVRNGCERTPHFGCLEVATVPLAASADEDDDGDDDEAGVPLTACLALWGLAMLAGDEAAPGQPGWRAEIGAPAEGTRRKALPVDRWIPKPQLAEKRAAKRSRGWVLPEDPVGRKEMGKRGVRYGAC